MTLELSPFIVNHPVGMVLLPKGFLTDWASIPFGIKNIYKFKSTRVASLLHDFLYTQTEEYPISRKDCDRIFHEVMINTGVNAVTACIFYWAVRMFGGSHFV
jgi:hypothetical protein